MRISRQPIPALPAAMNSAKPTFAVPSMAEIATIPWNGYNVISTFSGCGGSSLGYKLAGYRVLWASEFIPAAQEVYRRNHSGTILDTRDIRDVTAEDILRTINLKVGELDVFDGSPPCASFSLAGKRQKGWGQIKKYSDTVQRTDDLFFEYSRLLKGIQPKVFVAENVAGLVIGSAKGYFKRILSELKDCGYAVQAKVLDAQWLGVPQRRKRVIFIGVRSDLCRQPVFPRPFPYRYTVDDVLPWINKIEEVNGFNSIGLGHHRMLPARGTIFPTIQTKPAVVEAETNISNYALGKEWDNLSEGQQSKKYFNLIRVNRHQPSPTVTASGGTNPGYATITHPTERRKFSIAELKRICAFPDDFELTGSYAQQWERLGRAVPPVMMQQIAATIRDNILDTLKG